MEKKYISQIIRIFFGNNKHLKVHEDFKQWMLDERNEYEKNEVLFDIWNKLEIKADEADLKDLKQLHRRIPEMNTNRFNWKKLAVAAAILILPIITSLTTWFYFSHIQFDSAEFVECYVGNGERKMIYLPDSTLVWVNSATTLIYPKNFNSKTRSVYLSGEANFDVYKNPDKPFIVKTNSMDVSALGTVFNVKSYPETKRTITTLQEGKIKVDTKGNQELSFVLTPNEQIEYNYAEGLASVTKSIVDASKTSTWIQGYLVFQSASMDDIINSLQRKYDVTIYYDRENFKDRSFTIRFTPDQTIDETLDIMKEIILGFDYKIDNQTIYIKKY